VQLGFLERREMPGGAGVHEVDPEPAEPQVNSSRR